MNVNIYRIPICNIYYIPICKVVRMTVVILSLPAMFISRQEGGEVKGDYGGGRAKCKVTLGDDSYFSNSVC